MKTNAHENKHLNLESPILIIGTGLAGWSTAREFRKLNSTKQIVMLTAERGDFYAKPAISNAFAQKKEAHQLITIPGQKIASTVGVKLVQNTVVKRINTTTQQVETSEGRFEYSKLVLATGARAIKLQMNGDAVDEVISVNSLDDYATFREKLFNGARVLIVGAGLIGCEFANDLAGEGFEVHVVDPNSGPLISLLPQAVSRQLETALWSIGVKWHMCTFVQSVNYDSKKGMNVTFANGESRCVDVILSAVGLRANTKIAQEGGALCDRGIVVDATLQTSITNIYALGDNTQYASETLGGSASRTMPYVMPIMNAAKALAQTLNGTLTKVVFPVMPVAIKTSILPIVIAPPSPGTQGSWSEVQEGIWNYVDSEHKILGFLLVGSKVSQRSEQMKRMVPMT